jgi:hypothetical protein
MKERRPSGEPVLAEVGPPVILSLDVAGYRSVLRTRERSAEVPTGQPYPRTASPEARWPAKIPSIP